MQLRGLTGEQLFDSLAAATGYRSNQGSNRFFGAASVRGEFVAARNVCRNAERTVRSRDREPSALTQPGRSFPTIREHRDFHRHLGRGL